MCQDHLYPANSDSRNLERDNRGFQEVEKGEKDPFNRGDRVKAFQKQLEKDRRRGDELLLFDGWKLPGTWMDERSADCGQLIMFQCSNTECNSRKVGAHSCLRAVCPHCWKDAITRMTKRITRGKLLPFVQTRQFHRGKQTWPDHLVLSPPDEWWNQPVQKIRKKAAELAKEAGMTDGVAFFHPWRAKKHGWKMSPHVHFVAFGHINGQKVDEIHRRTGWVVNNIGHIANERSLYKVVWYNLSHCATKPGRSSYQYYGSVQKFKGEEIADGVTCPGCGSEMIFIEEEQWKVERATYDLGMGKWKDPPWEGFYAMVEGEFKRVWNENDLFNIFGVEPGSTDQTTLKACNIGETMDRLN